MEGSWPKSTWEGASRALMGVPICLKEKYILGKAWAIKISFDTLVHDTNSLQLLIKNQTSKQVLIGLDDPYPLGEMESVPQSSYPGKILDLARDRGIVTQEECDAMWEDNVIQWLCGDDEKAKKKLVERITS